MGKPHEVVKLDARKEVEHAYPSHDKLRCYFNPVPPTSLEVPSPFRPRPSTSSFYTTLERRLCLCLCGFGASP